MFGFKARTLSVLKIRKGRSNEEGKYLEFRPEGLAFFRSLITLLNRYPPRSLSDLQMSSGMAEFVRSSACLRVLQYFEIQLRTLEHELLQAKNLKSDKLCGGLLFRTMIVDLKFSPANVKFIL